MDAPRIQYAISADGTAIAYTVVGTGRPLVIFDTYLSAGLDWRLNAIGRQAFYEALLERCSLVLFDWRGSGLSSPADDFSLDRYVGDAQQVVDHLRLSSFDVLGMTSGSHVAVEFTSRNPENVRKLVLWRPGLKGYSARTSALIGRYRHLAHTDWDAYIQLAGLALYGWNDAGRTYMEQIKLHWTPELFSRCMDQIESFDVLPSAAAISGETLIVGSTEDPDYLRQGAQRFAAIMPNARLLVRRAGFSDSWTADLALLISEFLHEGVSPVEQPEAHLSLFRTILFTDIQGHTSMMQRLGDAKGREVLREHERLTREALSAHGGAEVKTMGDGFMASFGSAQRALECAIALQKAFDAHEGEPLRIRVGINAGEPIAEDDDLFGSSVIIAARTAAQAIGGEVLVTDVVRQLVAGKGFSFTERGDVVLRGIEEPVRLHQLVTTA